MPQKKIRIQPPPPAILRHPNTSQQSQPPVAARVNVVSQPNVSQQKRTISNRKKIQENKNKCRLS